MEDGRGATTDGEGRYSIPNVDARAHLVQVDLQTLPTGVTLSHDGIRHFSSGAAATVSVLPGELAVVRFEGTRTDAAPRVIADRRQSARLRIDAGQGAGDAGAGGAWSLPLERRYASLANRISAPLPSTGRTQREISVVVDRDTVAGSLTMPVMSVMEACGVPRADDARIETRGGVLLAPSGSNGMTVVPPARGSGVQEPAIRLSSGSHSVVVPVPPARLDTTANRAWRVTGLGQVRVGRGAALNQFIDTSWTDKLGNGPWTSAGRAAMVAEGWLGQTSVSARFDTERDQLGFAPGALIQSGVGYTLLGDAALRGQAMPTRATGAVTVRRDAFGLQAGDVQIRDLLPHSIAPLDRRVTGVTAEVTTAKAGVMAYAAPTRGRVMVEELQGRGVSGPYRLAQPQGLIPQSERIVLVTRDRSQSSLVVRTRELQRFLDYTIDPATGTIIFAQPIPSRDADLNPVSVRITSETTLGKLGMSGGAAVAFRLAPNVEVGLSAARDGATGTSSLDLGSVNLTIALSPTSLVELEVAGTKDGSVRGNALRFGARSVGKAGETTVQYQRASSNWRWQQSLLPAAREEAVVRMASPELWAHSRIDAEALHSANITDGAGDVRGSQTASLGVSTVWSRYIRSRFAVGGAHTDSIGLRPYALARLSAHSDSNGGASVWIEGARAVNDDASRIAIGASAPVAFRTSIYVQHEYRTGWATNVLPGPLGVAQRRTVAGVRSDAWSRVTPYGEYRARQGITALEAVAALGVRGVLPLRPGLTMTLAGEQVSNLAQVDSLRTTTALSTGAEWTGSTLGTFAFRTDWRGTRKTTNEWGGSTGFTRSWTSAWTSLMRSQWVYTPGASYTVRSQVAGAWRQPGDGAWNWLGRVEYWNDRGELGGAGDPSQQAATAGANPLGKRNAVIAASVLSVQPSERYVISWRAAVKSVREQLTGDAWLNSGGWLTSGRVVRSFGHGGWDTGMHGTLFGVGGMTRAAYGAEIGRRVAEGLRLAVGGNIAGTSDREFATVQPTQRGIYVDVTWGIAAQGVVRGKR
jgi:large repetitive protein